MSLLKIKNVSKKFRGVHAVEKLHFTIKPNTITGLIGPNGAGKTTAFNLITQFLPRDAGIIHFKDKPLSSRTAPHKLIKKGLARTFQQVRLFPNLTVKENLLLAHSKQYDSWWMSFVKRDESLSEKDAVWWLKKVNLEKMMYHPAGDLSYGQSKLVEIIRTIMTGAECLLLDEPASGINLTLLRTIESLLFELKKSGKTIVIIEHNMPFLMKISDEVIVMENGKFLCQDVPEKVQQNPKVLAAYLGKS